MLEIAVTPRIANDDAMNDRRLSYRAIACTPSRRPR